MRISDWSSDVCSSDLDARHRSARNALENRPGRRRWTHPQSQRRQLLVLELDPARLHPRTDCGDARFGELDGLGHALGPFWRSEEHTSELQSLMRISYAVFCLHKKTSLQQHRCLL